MSLRALTWALEHPDCPSAQAKLVLIGLANYVDARGWAWPASTTLAQLTHLDIKTVRSALDALERRGLIVDTTRRMGATKQVKVYALMVPPTARPESHPDTDSLPQRKESRPDTDTFASDEGSKAPGFPSKGTRIREAEPPKNHLPPPAKAGPPKGPKPEDAPKQGKGSRIPDDWVPPPADQLPPVTRSIVQGWPAGAYAFEAEQFRAHWAAENGPRAVKRDWGKAWATWLGRAVPDVNRMTRQGQTFEGERKAVALPEPVPCGCEQARHIRERMLTVMGMVAWRQWFAPLRFEIEGQRLIIRNATGFVKDWIMNNRGAELERAARPLALHWIIEKGGQRGAQAA
jgi:hypothetical protein